MSQASAETIYYKRSRFSTRLPVDRRYTGAHYWLLEESAGVWRVGFTKFATRMLGDLVEYEFSVPPGGTVSIGQNIGWIEGFKAISTIYSVAEGEFLGLNEMLQRDITSVESHPSGDGWLYRVRGRPEPKSVDVHGYVALLDATIDKMLKSRYQQAEENGE